MSAANNHVTTLRDRTLLHSPIETSAKYDLCEPASLDLSANTFNRALRDVALEELEIVRARYTKHRDPVRCAVGISLVLRSLSNELFGEERIRRLRRVSWLSFLLRTSDERQFRPHVIETMSAALYEDPADVELPKDCSHWFEAARHWIDHQHDRRPLTTCEAPVEAEV